ncbi:O-antigen ligase family protein [Candidatus Peregrinibacteria bacterium]|nr:O-antigen ligase family protein [Candidatus Peregrinibacteria bacterium]
MVSSSPHRSSGKMFTAIQICWGAFLISLFLPMKFHVEESGSFWSGIFSPFSTVFWPPSFFIFGFLLIILGIWNLGSIHDAKHKEKIPHSLIFSWSFFLVVGSISLWGGNVSGAALNFLLKWCMVGGIFYGIIHHFFRETSFVSVLAYIGLFEALLGISQTLFSFFSPEIFPIGDPVLRTPFGEIWRATGTLEHPNILGFFLVFVFFLLLENIQKWRVLRILLVLGIFCTFSKATLIALIIGSIASFDTLDKIDKRIVSFIILSVLSVFVIFFRHTFDNMSVSESERILQIFVSFQIFLKHPIFGLGLGNSLSEAVKIVPIFPWQLQPVHNVFLLILSETGIVGFLIFAFLSGSIIRKIFANADPKRRKLFFGISAAVCTFALFDHLLITSTLGMILFGIYAGLVFQNED